MKLKRFGIISFANMFACYGMLLLGIIAIVALIGIVFGGKGFENTSFIQVILMPIVGYIIFWLYGIIISSVMNVALSLSGGLKMEFEHEKEINSEEKDI